MRKIPRDSPTRPSIHYPTVIEPKEADVIQSTSAPAPSELLPTVVEAVVGVGEIIRQEFHRNGGPRGYGSKAPVDGKIEKILWRKPQEQHRCDWLGRGTGNANLDAEEIGAVD